MTSEARRPRPSEYAKTAGVRERILDAVLESCATDGFTNTTLKSVATRLGMSEAGILHHFGSKQLMLAAAVSRRDDRAQALVPPVSEGGVAVLRGLRQLMDENAKEPGVIEMFVALSAQSTEPASAMRSAFEEHYARLMDLLERAFTDLVAHGEMPGPTDPTVAARSLIAVMDGLQIQWLVSGRTFALGEAFAGHLRSWSLNLDDLHGEYRP